MAANKKRILEDAPANPKSKKPKIDSRGSKGKAKSEAPAIAAPSILAEEVDFPRGGGTSFTPLEVKTIRAEAAQEANDELFTVRPSFLTVFYVFDLHIILHLFCIRTKSRSPRNGSLPWWLQERSRPRGRRQTQCASST